MSPTNSSICASEVKKRQSFVIQHSVHWRVPDSCIRNKVFRAKSASDDPHFETSNLGHAKVTTRLLVYAPGCQGF